MPPYLLRAKLRASGPPLVGSLGDQRLRGHFPATVRLVLSDTNKHIPCIKMFIVSVLFPPAYLLVLTDTCVSPRSVIQQDFCPAAFVSGDFRFPASPESLSTFTISLVSQMI